MDKFNISGSCKWDIKVEGSIIEIGECKAATIEDWVDWLDAKEEFRTPRDSEEFVKIRASILMLQTYFKELKRGKNG